MNSDATNDDNVPSGPVVVGLGEALFDCFPDARHIGGAPVNLTAHCDVLLQNAGGKGIIASAIGRDQLGEEFTAFLANRSLNARFVQVHSTRVTGRVRVALDAGGEPSYKFEDKVAWDELQYNESWRCLASTCAAVSFGTLAQRSPTSRATIVQFLSDARQAVRLFDINLRQDFYSTDVIQQSLALASAAKFNREELLCVGKLLGLPTAGQSGIDDLAFDLMRRFALDWVAVTRGRHGTSLYAAQSKYEAAVPQLNVVPGADSVGAGDACGAGLLTGALLGWPHKRWVELANMLGAYVCSHSGAIPTLPRWLLAKISAGNEANGSGVRPRPLGLMGPMKKIDTLESFKS